MTKAERARELFLEGCNCAQAVFLAFAEEKMDRDTALKICLRLWRRDGRHAQCLRRSQWDVHGLRPALRPGRPKRPGGEGKKL